MKRFQVVSGVLATVLVLWANAAMPCGDKFLVVGRGVRSGRPQGVMRPASILLYVNPKSELPAALTESRLDTHLRKAGHRVRSAETRQELAAALQEGTVDVVMTGLSDMTALEPEVRAASSKPALLPVIYNPTGQELKAAEKKYTCVMKAPSRNQDYLDVINEALAHRSEQAKVK
jgi:hypothetical protein